ncbi:hypothetical protein BpHYR1_008799, partial [Brachionus plicatilis]
FSPHSLTHLFPFTCSLLQSSKVFFTNANKCVGKKVRIIGHKVVPLAMPSHLVNIFVNELERLLAQHGIVVHFGQYVQLNAVVHAQTLDQVLATLDLERLDEILLSSYVQVEGDQSGLVGQVRRHYVVVVGLVEERLGARPRRRTGRLAGRARLGRLAAPAAPVKLAKVVRQQLAVVQVLVELFDVVVLVLVEPHLDPHQQPPVLLEELVLLVENGVLVDQLLEAPVVGLLKSIYSVLDVDVVVVVVHDGEHHLNFERLVRQSEPAPFG